MAEMAYGGAAPVGRWGALLEGAAESIPYWVDVSRVTDVEFSRDDATGAVTATIRAEGGGGREVAGGTAPSGLGFAFTHRLPLAPGMSHILAEILPLGKTRPGPVGGRGLFHDAALFFGGRELRVADLLHPC